MLNCKEVARIVASDEFETLGAVKRFRVRLHLLFCRQCRRYVQQLKIIGSAARSKVKSQLGDDLAIARLEQAILINAFGGTEENH